MKKLLLMLLLLPFTLKAVEPFRPRIGAELGVFNSIFLEQRVVKNFAVRASAGYDTDLFWAFYEPLKSDIFGPKNFMPTFRITPMFTFEEVEMDRLFKFSFGVDLLYRTARGAYLSNNPRWISEGYDDYYGYYEVHEAKLNNRPEGWQYSIGLQPKAEGWVEIGKHFYFKLGIGVTMEQAYIRNLKHQTYTKPYVHVTPDIGFVFYFRK